MNVAQEKAVAVLAKLMAGITLSGDPSGAAADFDPADDGLTCTVTDSAGDSYRVSVTYLGGSQEPAA